MRRQRLVTAIVALASVLGVCGAACAQQVNPQAKSTAKESAKNEQTTNPVVVLATSMGEIHLELYSEKAPITVGNFLAYVREGFYDGLIFHRVIDGFMIQGGGFAADMTRKETKAPIKNEAANGLKNDRGTIAMARTNVVDSATSQFFINVVDNASLNHRDESAEGFGYCVFGKVPKGMDVVDAIRKVKTTAQGMYRDVPVEPIVIERAYVMGEEAKSKEPGVKGQAKDAAKPSEMRKTEKIEPRE